MELEVILKLKRRSIMMNVDTINMFLKNYKINGIIKEENYLYIDEREFIKIKKLLTHAPLRPIERRDYILLKLFFTNKIRLNSNFIELNLTRRTLNYDINKLKDYLKKYNLELNSLPSKGIFLVGEEKTIRELFANYLTKYLIEKNSCHKLFINLINDNIDKKEIKLIEKIVLKLLNRMNLKLPKEYFYKIVSIILVHEIREKQIEFKTQNYVTSKKLIKNKHYDLLSNFLKTSGLDKLKIYELDLISEIFLYFDKEVYEEYLEDEVKIFLENLEGKLNQKISLDSESLMKLSNIIRIGKFKTEFNFIDNEENHKFEKNYKKYYIYITHVIRNIIPKFYVEDILYLTIFIKDILNNTIYQNKKYQKIIIVDDSFNHIYGKILLKFIERNFYIKVSQIINGYELSEALNKELDLKFVLILGNLNIKKLEIPIIKITSSNIFNDFYELEQYDFLKR
ncbi:helix-turn-helix domain-containing protein [Cetobacterium sp.]|uniref:helix-turn-helix domain-containing protein n=1 Tax=Cetobacterium sp. TaxID=2071632 RepID=UPI003F66323F